MKKLISILMLSVLIISSLGITAFAADTVDVGEIPVMEFESHDEYVAYLESLERRGPTVISASVIRDGTSDDCELYLNWTGDEFYNGFRYKKITVKSTSALFPTTYETFGDGSAYTTLNVTASTVGSTKVGDLTIDSDVTKVKVKSTGLQGYNLKAGSWLSATEFSGTVTIN